MPHRPSETLPIPNADEVMAAAPEEAREKPLPTSRTSRAVRADLDDARERLTYLHQQALNYNAKRDRTLLRYREWQARWGRENPETPFDAEDVPDNCRVPGPESPVGRELYDLHYTIARLERELRGAKANES